MTEMRAAVISRHGGPEVLELRRLPMPEARPDRVLVRVRAFGVNHAEAYFRSGAWGDVAKVSGIECAGEVHDPGGSTLRTGQRVFALLGGMGRSIAGSYAEYVSCPASHVVAIQSDLDWTCLAAIPESYATAWTFLHHNLTVAAGQLLLVRGGTSALGQAAIQMANECGLRVLATTRSPDKLPLLQALGAEPLLDAPALSTALRARFPEGLDAVLDIVGTSTLLDSLKSVRYRGRVALAGFLGGAKPLHCDPLTQLPSGVQLSFSASAFLFGSRDLPLSEIPFQSFVTRAESGSYKVAPAHVFALEQIAEAHRLMESGAARGKIVVRVTG